MSLLGRGITAIENLRREVDALKRQIAQLQRRQSAPGELGEILGPGPAVWRATASQAEIVRVQVVTGTSGTFTARRLQINQSTGALEFDDEDGTAFTCYAAPGCTPFPKCQCLDLYIGRRGILPVYELFGGESSGWMGRITGNPQSHRYSWVEVGVRPGVTALTSTDVTLAYDAAQDAYDAQITQRKVFANNSVHAMRYDPQNARVVFAGGVDPLTDPC